MNKTVVKTFVLGMVMTTTTTSAFANVMGLPGPTNGSTVLVAPATNGATGSFLGEAGNYTVRTYDQTKIEQILLQLHADRAVYW